MTKAVVVGGGLAGLSCAVALSDRGMQVTVLEAAERLGGRASSWRDEHTGDSVDIGPHIFHSEYHNMLGFLERLGTRHLITWQPNKVLTLATRPAPLALRHAPLLPAPFTLMPSILRAPGLTMPDYLSMIKTGWRGMRFGEEQVAELDRVSALDFFRLQGVSERMIDWWWRFAAMVVTNVPLERCSTASMMRIHAQLSGYKGLHFGFGAVGLGELYTGQARRVVEEAGGRVLTDSPVRAFSGDGRIDGAVLLDGTRVEADVVVSALPPTALAPLLSPGQRQGALASLEWFEPSPYICCYLWFDRPLAAARFTSHLWSPGRLNYDFYDLRQIRHGWAQRPSIFATNIIYSHRAEGMRDDEIVRATVAELAEFAPDAREAKLLHARVHRVPMAIPCPLVGFEERRPPQRSPLPGLVLAGDWTRTRMPCTMEGAVKSGRLAAEAVLEELGRPEKLAIEARMYDGVAGMVRRTAARRPKGVP